MTPIFFANQDDFRQWLEEHHTTATELIVGYYKVDSGKPSMTWSESVDQALCFGWIDGIRRSIDAESYCIRFTPRKPTSIWSAVNIQKVAELTEKGLMKPGGLAAFAKRKPGRSKVYAYESPVETFDEASLQQFKANAAAWAYFERKAPSYRKNVTKWVMNAKQETTKAKRLAELIADCAQQQLVKHQRYGKIKK